MEHIAPKVAEAGWKGMCVRGGGGKGEDGNKK